MFPFVFIFDVCSSFNSCFDFCVKFVVVQRPANLNAATYLSGICWILIRSLFGFGVFSRVYPSGITNAIASFSDRTGAVISMFLDITGEVISKLVCVVLSPEI